MYPVHPVQLNRDLKDRKWKLCGECDGKRVLLRVFLKRYVRETAESEASKFLDEKYGQRKWAFVANVLDPMKDQWYNRNN